MYIEEIYDNVLGKKMETLHEICETLDHLTENEKALHILSEEMELEKEALMRAKDSLLARLDFLKEEYQKTKKLFSKMKYMGNKQEVYEKILTYNRLSSRPLLGYLDLFRESNVKIRKRRMSKVLVAQ